MRPSPALRFVTFLLLVVISSTTTYSQSTKPKKGGSGDQGSSNGDKSSSDGTDDGSGGTKGNADGKDTSKNDDKSKGDTSKTGFDDGTYAESTAITYKAMQSIAAGIADKGKNTNGTAKAKIYVVFDPTTFANIAQYRITFPQVVLLRTSLCMAFDNMEAEKTKEKTDAESKPPAIGIPKATYGASAGGLNLSPAGQIVDLAQKVLAMLQTTTTIAGASVNVTDEALVTEVANQLANSTPRPDVYFPGEFLLPDVGEVDIRNAMKDGCNNAGSLGDSHHIVAEVVRLGVAREKAAQSYQLLTAALDKYNSIVNPSTKKANTDQTAQPNQTGQTDKAKKKKPNGAAAAAHAEKPVPAEPEANQAHVPTAQEKADALNQFFAETGFTDSVIATGYQISLKAYMDAYDALLTSLAASDSKGQSIFSRLVIAERLNSILKQETHTKITCNTTGSSEPKSADQKDQANECAHCVNVVIVKWLRAGALNKTRKNLFFLGQRNYYAGGATGLYEYFDGDQKILASGTITETSPYVHDKDFDKGKVGTMITLPTDKPAGGTQQ